MKLFVVRDRCDCDIKAAVFSTEEAAENYIECTNLYIMEEVELDKHIPSVYKVIIDKQGNIKYCDTNCIDRVGYEINKSLDCLIVYTKTENKEKAIEEARTILKTVTEIKTVTTVEWKNET